MPDSPQMTTSNGFKFNLQNGQFHITRPPPLLTHMRMKPVEFFGKPENLARYGIIVTEEDVNALHAYFDQFLEKDSKLAYKATPVFTSSNQTRFELYTLLKDPSNQRIRVTFPNGLEIPYGPAELEEILKDPVLRKKENIRLVRNELLRLQRALVPYLTESNVVPLPTRRKK